MLNEAYGMNKWAKQVSINDLTGFRKEMNRLKMNPDQEHQEMNTRRKLSGGGKISIKRSLNVCENDIWSCWY